MQPSLVTDKRSNHWHRLHVAEQSWDELAEHHPNSIHLTAEANCCAHEPADNNQQEPPEEEQQLKLLQLLLEEHNLYIQMH